MNPRLLLKGTIRRMLPRTLKPHTVLAGPLRGCRLQTSWHDYPGALLGSTERALLDWFGKNVSPGESWLDIGAHYGYVSLSLCRLVGPKGHVFAFEPVAATAECIALTKKLNDLENLTIVAYALGSTEGFSRRDLRLVRGMADSTVHGDAPCECITVTSLDYLWPRIAPYGVRIHGVKIDVQGMEIDTLNGMNHFLATHRPKLIVEMHAGVDRDVLTSFLCSVGYRRRFQPIEPDSPTNTMLNDRSYLFLPSN